MTEPRLDVAPGKAEDVRFAEERRHVGESSQLMEEQGVGLFHWSRGG